MGFHCSGAKAGGEAKAVAEEKEQQIPLNDPRFDFQAGEAGPLSGVQHHHQAADEKGEGAEHEGGADDRPDAHLLLFQAFAGDKGDQRDQGLGQGGAHRRQDAADSAFSQVQA